MDKKDAKEGVVARKTVKARLSNDPRLQTLYSEWNHLMWKAFWMRYASNFSRKTVVKYCELASQTPLAKYYVNAAIKLTEGKAKAYQSLRRRQRNAKHQREFDEPVQLTNSNTYRLSEASDGIYASISFTPGTPIEAKLIFGKDDENGEVLRKALSDNTGPRVKGAKLLQRNGEWWLHIAIEKDVKLLDATQCETVIGVDVGQIRLAVATARTRDGKVVNPLFISGHQAIHLALERRKNLAELQRLGFSTAKIQRYYNARIDELLHIAAKQIVEYAKHFPKPVIVLEDLCNLKAKGKSKKQRYLLAMWARKRLQQYITYKATWDSIPVVYVNPIGTSQKCRRCGAKGERRGVTFRCRLCRKVFDADANASINLIHRFDEWKTSWLEQRAAQPTAGKRGAHCQFPRRASSDDRGRPRKGMSPEGISPEPVGRILRRVTPLARRALMRISKAYGREC